MKRYLEAFAMTQSMFCALPVPCRSWDEKARPLMLIFLPVIGLEIGVLWLLLGMLMRFLQLPGPVFALCMCALPYLATGMIHLDGFLDVVDAVCSWRDPQQRRAILKDPHVGSFAVVYAVFLILAGYAFFSAIAPERKLGILVLIPVVSRCCSALAVMHLPAMSTSQFHETAASPGWHSTVLILILIISTLFAFALWKTLGFSLVAVMAGYALALRRAYTSLEGMNGDVAGFSLTVGEVCGVAMLALL